ncbi:substrate-binding domain-containing protein [Geomonas nitrogeniifigens]|uniref:Substrate-binding domain-containing protein n=1 Tax=Geomonas diazotrophica TaxID=2843197 RepID=A0ABX8JL96_9BACT|nr:substrate-binding domain-containing protein [Geomonas nitrogeniifigens]QWV97422.1 substrate-binding domain-containing protein [Geomonas nitrogeniifigens]QXE86580.1 substrate-binding domain-containing protein [Geomonas nitrogeniifigens]
MKRSVSLCMLVIAVCFSAGCTTFKKDAANQTSTPEVIRIGGGDTALTEVIAPVKETFEDENPSLRLVTVQSKPGTELADLDSGSLDAVVSTLDLQTFLERAAANETALDGDEFREVPVGTNETVVFLNQGVKIKKLTRKQLKAIFTGKITNWKKVGGPNRHIVVVWSPAADGENELFIRKVLEGEQVVSRFLPVASVEEMRAKVLETPGAVGIGPSALVSRGVRVPGTGSLTVVASVMLITKGEPSPKVQKLLDLLKDVAFLR